MILGSEFFVLFFKRVKYVSYVRNVYGLSKNLLFFLIREGIRIYVDMVGIVFELLGLRFSLRIVVKVGVGLVF